MVKGVTYGLLEGTYIQVNINLLITKLNTGLENVKEEFRKYIYR